MQMNEYGSTVRLVVFDWAGTTVDFGCCAPTAAFVDGFARQNVQVSMQQAREPMGMEKRDHIEAVSRIDEVARRWRSVHGREVRPEDINAMYATFVPRLLEILPDYSELIAGVREAVGWLRSRNIAIGASTGYFREAADIVARRAAAQGYVPDCSVCASEVSGGRPAPWMIYRVMERLKIYPPEAVINVGDTIVDVESGRNGGVWSVAVAATGNLIGVTQQEAAELAPPELAGKIATARTRLGNAGAHYVIDSVAELPGVVEQIEERLRRGEKP